MTSLPALMMSITVKPGFRSRRESATLSQQCLGVTVLGFSLEEEKCLYTCDAFNWEKELGWEDDSTQRQQIRSVSLASQDWFIMASQSFMESTSLDLKLFFNRPKHPLTKHRVCLTLMNIACYTTSGFVRGDVT